MVQTPFNLNIREFISRAYIWSLYIFALTLPVRPFFLQNILSYSLILFLIFALAKIFVNRDFLGKEAIVHILFLSSIFIWWGISLTYSSDLNLGLKYMETKLGLILIPGFILFVKPVSREDFVKILKVYAIGVTAYLLISYLLVFFQNYQYNGFKHVVYPFYMYHSLVHFIGMHATYMAVQVAAALLIVLDMIIDNKQNERNSFLHYLWIAFLIFALLSLTVKMITLGFVLALFAYAIFRLGFISSLRIILPVFLVISISIYILSDHDWFIKRVGLENKEMVSDLSMDPENEKGTWGSLNMRYAVAMCAIDVIGDNVFFGTGIGDEKAERRSAYEKKNFRFALNRDFNEHNQYLNVWLNSGIIGLIILLSILIVPFYLSIKYNNALYFAWIVLIGIAFLSENYLSRQIGVAFFAFFNALFWQQLIFGNQTIRSKSL